MTNHQNILDVLRRANGNWVCTTVFDTMFIRDHRKRVSELIDQGYKIESEPCRGSCGKEHNSNIYKRRLATGYSLPKDFTPKAEPRAVQPEKSRTEAKSSSQGSYAYDKPSPVKSFIQAYEEERKFRGRPLTKAEMNLLAKKFK